MRSTHTFAAVIALTTVAHGAAAQPVVRIVEPAGCDCAIRLERVLTIGDPDGRAGLAAPLTMMRTTSGEYLVVPMTEQAAVLRFDSAGAFIGRIGRRGAGPAEFAVILDLQRGPGDSILVLDSGNGRLTVLDPTANPARTVRLDKRGGQVGALSDGRTILLGPIARMAEPPDRLHLLDAAGSLIGSFMPQPPIGPTTSESEARRRIDVSPDGTIAVSHSTDYAVEIWSAAGEHARTLVRDVPWFPNPEPGEPDRRRPGDPPAPRLEQARLDGDLVWTLAHVADDRWRDALTPMRIQGRVMMGAAPAARDRYHDSIIELIDATSGALLGTVRVDPHILFLLDDRFAASYREDEIGQPFIDIWRLEPQPR